MWGFFWWVVSIAARTWYYVLHVSLRVIVERNHEMFRYWMRFILRSLWLCRVRQDCEFKYDPRTLFSDTPGSSLDLATYSTHGCIRHESVTVSLSCLCMYHSQNRSRHHCNWPSKTHMYRKTSVDLRFHLMSGSNRHNNLILRSPCLIKCHCRTNPRDVQVLDEIHP